ncbi:putative hydro-lyase [Nostoc sp. CHAB 5784]|uniref:putative hydro-lyase n=1 Tax=Nostoc mirabile TaxID=2907820 RepID=UPI001E5ECAFB|nr:putative hydro-lyase [Nostoc mirabile]MCC5664982.1 putative hydro-lyase [Nostoc mirabile CHAB5784]
MLNFSSLPSEIRQLCRDGKLDTSTSGLALGFVQANLVVLPYSLAFEFLLFCQRNSKACPILDVTEVGDYEPKIIAPGGDIRTDLPRYRIFQHGKLIEETTNIKSFWKRDLVAFLIGCSFSFENAMLNSRLPVRHVEEQKNVPMYKTNIECIPTRMFSSPLVVSMRPLPANKVVRAVEVTSRYYKAHGSPVHIGNPEVIGIKNLEKPDYGDAVTVHDGEIPVFWACGVTTQTAIMQAKPELAITHSPGYMFISDLKDEYLTF